MREKFYYYNNNNNNNNNKRKKFLKTFFNFLLEKKISFE